MLFICGFKNISLANVENLELNEKLVNITTCAHYTGVVINQFVEAMLDMY